MKFFPSIDHQIMLQTLKRRICDENFFQVVQRVIDSGVGVHADEVAPHWFPGDDLLSAARPKGLPIGNLTSQFFANALLDQVDHFIKEKLGVPGYVRYADDLLLFGATKQDLWKIRGQLQERLAEIRLRLHPNKTHVHPSHCGVLFLGMRVWAHQKRLSQQAIRRFNRRRKRLQYEFGLGQIDCKDVRTSLDAWSAWTAEANASQIQQTLFRKVKLKRTRATDGRSGLGENGD